MPKTTMSELKAEIEQIKLGYKEVAKIVGENKGILNNLEKDLINHIDTPDAHNPAYLSRRKDGK